MKRVANLLTVLVVLGICLLGVTAPFWLPFAIFGGILAGAIWVGKIQLVELRDDIYNWLERRAVREA